VSKDCWTASYTACDTCSPLCHDLSCQYGTLLLAEERSGPCIKGISALFDSSGAGLSVCACRCIEQPLICERAHAIRSVVRSRPLRDA